MKYLLSLFFGCLLSFSTFAQQIDTIALAQQDLQINQLKEGTRTYLEFIERADGSVAHASIWERTVSFGKHKNEDVVIIEQNWKNQDTIRRRYLYSISRRKDFSPIYHRTRNGQGTIEAYNFTEGKVIGADSVANNTKKGFEVAHKQPLLNWELDMETFQTLPFKKGTTFVINFYHPGGKTPPQYYEYKVAAEEKIATGMGEAIACWRLDIQYGSEGSASFWFSKATSEMIKMKSEFNGIKRYKIKFATPS
ncbi:MAG: hypothetical protein ACFB0B_04785 [Thermonemataceae bacterium]